MVQAFAVACADRPAPTASAAETTAQSDAQTGDATDASACPGLAQMPGGGCCPAHKVWLANEVTCAAVGPPECASLVVTAAERCIPRWCADWRDSDGQPCADRDSAYCGPAARACTAAELVAGGGCLAGTTPGVAGSCAPPPTFAAHSAPADLLAQLPAPATPAAPRWCTDGPTAPPRDCLVGETGCPVGQEPDPAKPGSCRPLQGTDLVCPKGFVAKPTAGPALPDCAPDPADCGDDPFGGVAEGPNAVFVDAAFTGASAGTRVAPYSSLAQAIEAAPAGATVAVARGTYPGGLQLAKPLQLRGRCAAMVHLKPEIGESALVLKAGADGSSVQGLRVTGGTEPLYVSMAQKVELRRILVDAGQLIGILVTTGASAQIVDSVVSHTVGDQSDVDGGTGIAAVDASVQVSQVRVTRSRGIGVVVSGGGKLTLTDCVVDEGNPQEAKGPAGMGAYVGQSSSLTVRRSRLHRNGAAGVKLKGKGAQLLIERSAVTSTRPWWTITKTHGLGLHGQTGAQIFADAVLIHDNRSIGAAIEQDGDGVLQLQRSAVTGTRRLPEGTMGVGLAGHGKVQVELSQVLLDDNERHSAMLGFGALATLERVLVRGNRLGLDPKTFSSALLVHDGAHVDLQDVSVWDNADCGVHAYGAGVQVAGRRLLVGHTRNRGLDDVLVSPGVYVESGVHLWLLDSRIHRSEGVGVLVGGPDSAVRLTGTTIDDTRPLRSNGDYGLAVVAQGGAQVALDGVRTTANHGAAVAADQPQTRIAAHGLLVDHTRPRHSDSGGGHGVYGAHGAALELTGTLVVDNYATGIAVDKSSLLADRCAVRMTRFANLIEPDKRQLKVALGDALLAVQATGFAVRDSIVLDNQRAGLLVDSTAGAKLSASLVARGTFGLVTQNSATLAAVGNLVYGHTQQNRVSDGGLAVPQPPGLVGK